MVGLQNFHRLELGHRGQILALSGFQKVIRLKGNVLGPFAKGGNLQAEDVQTLVKIVAKLAFGDHRFE